MPLPQFISRLNWRLIIIHMVACWLFINAFWMFSYLHDLELIGFIGDHRPPTGADLKHNEAYLKEFVRFGSGRIYYMLVWAACGEIVGLSIGLGVSLFIVIKKHWYWLNSLIVFVAFILFGLLRVKIWRYVGSVFFMPGSFFKEDSIGYLLANGLVMFGLGILLFFLPALIRFINSGWPEIEKKPILAKSPRPENEI